MAIHLSGTAVRVTNLCPDKGPSFDMRVTMTDATIYDIAPGQSQIIAVSGANNIANVQPRNVSSGPALSTASPVDIG